MEKVAFIISVYNKDILRYFKQSIESIINQDYGFENINIYLGIDGVISNDILQYIKVNSKYFYKTFQNKENYGLAYTLNRIINNLEGENYIFRMDSDDICRKDRVTKQLSELQKDKDLLLIGSSVIEIDEKHRFLRKKNMPVSMKEIINYAIVRSPFNHPTIAVKKAFFQQVGVYNEVYKKAQDYELWSRALMKNIKMKNINDDLVYFRISVNYLDKRNSLEGIQREFLISLRLMIFFKKYWLFYKIILKTLIRVSPKFISNIAYRIIRD
jgi:hypothetical protein